MERPRKRELRQLNARAWAGDQDAFAVGDNLDSSMKKNTAFIKRLRTAIAASTISTFLQEIRTLSLHKYLSEIISACFEGLSKLKVPGDVAAGVEIVSALHQRFGPQEFTSYMGWLIGRGLSTPEKVQLKTLAQDVREKEEKERLARHRVLLRIATELWLVGVLRSLEDIARPEEVVKGKENGRTPATQQPRSQSATSRPADADAEPFPLEVLKDLLGQDVQHTNLPMVASYLKTFAWDLLGRKSVEEDGTTTDDNNTTDDTPLVDAPMQQRFKNVLVQYYDSAKPHLIRDQDLLNSQSKRNAEAYVRSGEIFEDRQANYEKQVKAQEKFVTNMQILADALGLELPDLKEKNASNAASDGTIGLVKTGEYLRGEGEGSGIWEDEDERRFYENLIDLKDRVPTILLEDSKKKKAESESDQVGKRTEETQDDGSKDKSTPKDDDAEASTAIANKTVGAQVDALLARLPDITSKEMVDEAAVDFCFVNSKASRNRLIKAVQEVPKGRTDLLPFYSRLITTLSKYMPDVSLGLVGYLDVEFRSLQRRKQKDTLGGVRTSNIRYLAELTKFGLVPEHVIFHCLKVSLDDFSRMNIEIICNLLENCGRYLLRNPETAPRMKSFLETLQRKKGASHLGQQERMLIENASYYVNPPERAAIQQKERTPMDLFVRKLIYMDLSKRNLEKVAKQIRKLHWEEDDVVNILRKIFVKPHNIKYSNIHFLAIILGSIHRYHQDFSISVIDDLLEAITIGLELNDFKFNQRRIAEVRYLGELYVYRMVDSTIIFDTLFKLLTFGHYGWPKPGDICPIDLPDDFFRIRLVCNILETCGVYYEKGPAKKKLDFFLAFLQYYVQTKEPLPMDIEFVLQDAFALVRPQWKLATTLEEAGSVFAEAVKENVKSGPLGKATEAEEVEELDDEDDIEGRRTPNDEDKSSDEEADDVGQDEAMTPNIGSDDDEAIVVTRYEDERDPEADADFDRELAKMMSESVETRKFDRRPVFDVALPMRRTNRDISSPPPEAGEEVKPQESNIVKFSLLSKKGNRPQTRSIDLPADSTFAIAMRSQQEAERAEQQRIKALVLNYDMQRNEADDGSDGHNNGTSSRSSTLPYIPSAPIPSNSNRRNRHHAHCDTPANAPDQKGIHHIAMQDRQSSANPAGQAQYPTLAQSATMSSNSSQSGPRNGNGAGGGTYGRRNNQQARKLQLSDVDWYAPNPPPNHHPDMRANAAVIEPERNSGVPVSNETGMQSPRGSTAHRGCRRRKNRR